MIAAPFYCKTMSHSNPSLPLASFYRIIFSPFVSLSVSHFWRLSSPVGVRFPRRFLAGFVKCLQSDICPGVSRCSFRLAGDLKVAAASFQLLGGNISGTPPIARIHNDFYSGCDATNCSGVKRSERAECAYFLFQSSDITDTVNQNPLSSESIRH